jgi:hypothetical protein
MKIYFAGTKSRENMGINKRLKVLNHLESYYAISTKNFEKFLKDLLEREIDENTNDRTEGNS